MIALDDNIADHPKFVGLSPAAAWLWVWGIGYCRRNRTDGFIPGPAALARGTKKVVGELLAAPIGAPSKSPLWSEAPGGYQVHDYLDWNPSRAEVEAKSEQKRAAGRAGGEASGEARRKRLGHQLASDDEPESKHRASDSFDGRSDSFVDRSTKTNPGSGSGSGTDPEIPPTPQVGGEPPDRGSAPGRQAVAGPVALVWDAYVAAYGASLGASAAGRLVLTEARRKLIRKRIDEHGAETVAAAGRGVFRDGWCVERRKVEPEWCWRNAGQVEKFAALDTGADVQHEEDGFRPPSDDARAAAAARFGGLWG